MKHYSFSIVSSFLFAALFLASCGPGGTMYAMNATNLAAQFWSSERIKNAVSYDSERYQQQVAENSDFRNLSYEDKNKMRQAAETVLEDPQVGKSKRWIGDNAQGKVEIVDEFKDDGRPCYALEQELSDSGRQTSVSGAACREAGDWTFYI